MARILVIYSSDEGQTARIALRIAQIMRDLGAEIALRDIATPDSGANIGAYDGVVIGAAIHFGRHSKQVTELTREKRLMLRSRHSAFFSVSLSAGGPSRNPARARRYVEEFISATGWNPDRTACFGGAVRPSRYGFLRALLMRKSLDLSAAPAAREREYTDWEAVARFADDFAKLAAEPRYRSA